MGTPDSLSLLSEASLLYYAGNHSLSHGSLWRRRFSLGGNLRIRAGQGQLQLLPQDWRLPTRRTLLPQAHQAPVLADHSHPQHVPEPGSRSGLDVEPALATERCTALGPEPRQSVERGRNPGAV